MVQNVFSRNVEWLIIFATIISPEIPLILVLLSHYGKCRQSVDPSEIQRI